MNIDLLQELTEAHGTSGYEDAIRAIVIRELTGVGEIHIDAMGSVHCRKTGAPGAKKLMIAAHMDEIGFVVKHIDDKGFLRVHTIGGWDPRQMNAQRVIIQAKSGPKNGVLMYGTKPKHMLTDAEANAGQNHDSFFIDTGLTPDEAKSTFRLGDQVTMDRKFSRTGHLLTSKAMDDRVGVFVMIEAIRAAKSNEVEVIAVATTQEEIGLRGATAAGSAIAPDLVVALDITLANDIPGVPDQDAVTRLGQGTAIKIMDSSLICHPRMVEHFRDLAEHHGIPHQMEVLPRGGTDAGGIQRLHGGVPSITLSIPSRYVHTVNESVHEVDVQASIDLLARYIESAHERSYAF